MSKSKIAWTEITSNPVVCCNRVSPGCDNCYAIAMAKRLEAMGIKKYNGLTKTNNQGKVDWTGKLSIDINALLQDVKKFASPRFFFVPSMGDLFHKNVPTEIIYQILAIMVFNKRHIFQIVTKRPNLMKDFFDNFDFNLLDKSRSDLKLSEFDERYSAKLPFRNIWLGTSVENQTTLEQRAPIIQTTIGYVKWLSIEPLLGPVKLDEKLLNNINWVVVGGESGLSARPCKIEWIESVVEACHKNNVPVFVKQLGKKPYYNHEQFRIKGILQKDQRRSEFKHTDIKYFPKSIKYREYPHFRVL